MERGTIICGANIPEGSNVLVPDISFPSTRNALNMSGNKTRMGIHFYNNERNILALVDVFKDL